MITVVSNRNLIEKSENLLNVLKKCCTSNVDRIIIREKDLDCDCIEKMVAELMPYAKSKNIDILVNGPYTLDDSFGSNGRHYSFDQFMNLKSKINYKVGVSVHSLKEIKLLNGYKIDYVLYGHVFETNCKKNKLPRGVESLLEIRNQSVHKVIPIGGINLNNYNQLSYNLRNDFALMSSIMEVKNPEDYIHKFRL